MYISTGLKTTYALTKDMLFSRFAPKKALLTLLVITQVLNLRYIVKTMFFSLLPLKFYRI